MGFLHKLWDETLAGPTPDTGLGKLRKFNSFSASPSPPLLLPDDQVPISRAITILRSSNPSDINGSAPDSPIGPTTPSTPLTPGTPGGEFNRFTRRRWPTDHQPSEPDHQPTSPTVYDWIVITALDR